MYSRVLSVSGNTNRHGLFLGDNNSSVFVLLNGEGEKILGKFLFPEIKEGIKKGYTSRIKLVKKNFFHV